MFKRAHEVRGHQRLSGADRKKIRRNLRDAYPGASDVAMDSLLPSKAEISVTKLSNRTILYAEEGSPPTFFDIDGRGKDILPTVFALWKVPELLPSLELKGPEVSRYLLGGADLMLPGIQISDESGSNLPEFTEGDVLAVKVPGNCAPIAVGLAVTSKAKALKSGMRGKGVQILHHYMDTLWETAKGRYVPNAGFQDGIVCEDPTNGSLPPGTESDPSDPEKPPEEAETEMGASDGQPGASSAPVGSGQSQEERVLAGVQDLKLDGDADVAVGPAEMEALLDRCLLQAIRVSLKDKDLPMAGSALWSNFVVPNRPPAVSLDVKKTVHKKLSKWLQSVAQRGLISVKEDKHNKETVLLAVNRKHPEYLAFVPEKKLPEQLPDPSPPPSTTASLPPVDISQVYKVTHQVAPIFQAVGADQGRLYLAQEASEVVFRYIEKENLTHPLASSVVVLDAALCDALFKGAIKKGAKYPAEVLKRDVGGAFVGRMQANHVVTRGDRSSVGKGVVGNLQIVTERRAGNKKVTRVIGVEGFLLDAESLAGELQKKFACSTSVSEVVGRKGQFEVLLQGGMVEELGRHLWQHYGVPKKFIEILDKTKK